MKASEFIKNNLSENGGTNWPTEAKKKDELAGLMLGATIVQNVDHWIEHANDIIKNESLLSSLSDEQQQLIENLIVKTSDGILQGLFRSIDTTFEFDGKLEVKISSDTDEDISIKPYDSEFVYQYYEWIKKFSKFSEKVFED